MTISDAAVLAAARVLHDMTCSMVKCCPWDDGGHEGAWLMHKEGFRGRALSALEAAAPLMHAELVAAVKTQRDAILAERDRLATELEMERETSVNPSYLKRLAAERDAYKEALEWIINAPSGTFTRYFRGTAERALSAYQEGESRG